MLHASAQPMWCSSVLALGPSALKCSMLKAPKSSVTEIWSTRWPVVSRVASWCLAFSATTEAPLPMKRCCGSGRPLWSTRASSVWRAQSRLDSSLSYICTLHVLLFFTTKFHNKFLHIKSKRALVLVLCQSLSRLSHRLTYQVSESMID